VRSRQFKEAEATFERARTLDPNLAAASSALAYLYWLQNDLPRAEQAFAAATAREPAHSQRRLQHAQFLIRTGQFAAGRQMLQELIQKTPDLLPSFVMLGELELAERKPAACIELLDKVLARDPAHVDALSLSARAKLESGEIDKALLTIERAATLYPKAAPLQYQLGLTYLAKGDLAKATRSLTLTAKLAPGVPIGTLALAELNLRRGDPGPAVIALKDLTERQPGIVEAWMLLAKAYHMQGNLDEALATYRRIEKTSPQSVLTNFLMGLVLLQQKKAGEARPYFTKAIQLAPDYFLATEQLVNLDLAEKQPAAARQRIEGHIAKHPTEAGAYVLLARVALAQADAGEAETALRKAVELQPTAVEIYLTLAQLLGAMNQPEKAMATLKAAAEKNPKDTRPLMQMALVNDNQKNLSAAREYYEKVLAIAPNVGAALNNLAYLYSEKFGELDKAAELAQRARDLFPHEPHLADTLGWIYYKQRQYPRALSLLEESSAKLGDIADVSYHLGMTQYIMGQEDAARGALERALKLSADFSGAEEARRCLSVLALDPATADAAARGKLEALIVSRKDDPVALTRLAAVYEREGDLKKAVSAYEEALNANPGSTNVAVALIRLYRARDETAKAFELAKATRKLAPTDGKVAQVLGRLAYDTGDYPWAMSLLQEARRKYSDNPDVLYDFAEAAYSVGEVSAAENALRDALQSEASFARASKARDFLEMVGFAADPEKAAAAAPKIETVLKADPASVPALMAKGAIVDLQRDATTAKSIYEKVLSRFPDFTPAQKRLVILSAESSTRDDKTIEIAAKARKALPKDAELAKAFGIILFRQGNYSRSASLLEESARARPTDAEVLYYLGMAQHQLKDRTASTRSLQRSVELGLREDLATEAGRILAATNE
jgi:tetratricopeptide (TPR) repeat protein